MSRWKWLLSRLSRRVWVRTSLIGLLGLLTAAAAAVLEHFLPWQLAPRVTADAADSLLTIIASSMLAVTTFSLSIMVSAYGSATSNVSPRATRLLVEDTFTQTVLANFVGSFLFAICGLVLSKSGAYSEQGRAILFAATIAVIVLIVISLLRWIDHLVRLGRVGETTNRIEDAARQAMEERLRRPCLGGVPWSGADDRLPTDSIAVRTAQVGYVQHIDMEKLASVCEAQDCDLYITAQPGAFVYPEAPLAWLVPRGGEVDAEALGDALRGAFSLGNERSFEQDPRFGLAVMSEVGSRALSPATNDPGTAIDVLGRLTRLLNHWAIGESRPEAPEPIFPRLHVAPIQAEDLFDDAFMLIARDGAGLIEVQLMLQKALMSLARVGDEAFRQAALNHARRSLARAEEALPHEVDRQRLQALVQRPERRGA